MNTVTVGAARPRSVNPDRLFFTGMSVACALTVFVGFAPTYYFGRAGLPPLSPLLHLHAAVFTFWSLLFVAQTMLVTVRRTDLHRQLGIAAAALATAMVFLGVAVAIDSLRRGVSAPGIDPRVLVAIPLSSILGFALLLACAIAFRRNAAMHKRLMLLANVSLLSAAIGRVVLRAHVPVMALFLFTDLFVIVVIAYDLVRQRRIHAANIWGGALIVAKPVFVLGAMTGPWLAFAGVLR